MCIGYDPFKWADIYSSEEEYFEDLEREESMSNKIEIDLDSITARRDELMDLKARYSFELKQVEKEMEKLDLQLIALLDQTGTESMDYGTYTFGWKTTNRTAFDQKLFGQDYPELLAKYKIAKENRVFDFKINR